MKQSWDVIIIGGGAAGFFAAINIAEQNPKWKIAILERGKEVLTKVKISGGGRCNVTHACFDPNVLTSNYPRGQKELRGPFHVFDPSKTIEWFEKRGVLLKTEADGRMFPQSNSSQTIIDCFLGLAKKLGISVLTSQSVQGIYKSEFWKVETPKEHFISPKLVIATGSNPKIWEMLQGIGIKTIEAVPSLFTFNITDKRLKDLAGLSANAEVRIKNSKLEASGPVLITHWGLSGPAILKLSAWGARILAERNYQFAITVNWLPDLDTEDAVELLKNLKTENPKKNILKKTEIDLPNRLWERMVLAAQIPENCNWADINNKQIQQLALQLTDATYQVSGKSTFKDEFVTAGGVDLKEINFKTMASKKDESLFIIGECLNIDAITGGFNFQNAWTTAHLAAAAITAASNLEIG